MDRRDFDYAVNEIRIMKSRMKMGWNIDEDVKKLDKFLMERGMRLERHPLHVYTIKPN
jgi:hypothetical protein